MSALSDIKKKLQEQAVASVESSPNYIHLLPGMREDLKKQAIEEVVKTYVNAMAGQKAREADEEFNQTLTKLEDYLKEPEIVKEELKSHEMPMGRDNQGRLHRPPPIEEEIYHDITGGCERKIIQEGISCTIYSKEPYAHYQWTGTP